MKLLKYFKIGFWSALLGGIAGLFLAKKSGKELYQDVKKTGEKIAEKAEEIAEKVEEKAKETVEEVKETWEKEEK
ncbi:MAG: YtxH domain-containing protein [Patescibacteria group bacterium]